MADSDVCPAEDAILAFLEYLVDPMLPPRSSVGDTPPLSQQQLVAKQVQAVVLLYNYYHRKQHPQLKFEGFESFCKLAVVQRPTLLAHMKLMQRSNDSELIDLEKQLSLMEKTIMDACDISKSLDASKDVPSTEGCTISKIAVFLIDSRKDNCFLQFSSTVHGVWSVIEKDVNVSSFKSEDKKGKMERKHIKKKTRVIKQPLRDQLRVDEVFFEQLAFSAVKEATGYDQSDLIIVESHVVYSLSKEKTAARFYMMQCTQPKNDDVIQFPIEDAINSLQGPLVMKISGQWTVTPVVEYFHVLPYAGIVADWHSREVLSNTSEEQRLGFGSINVSSSRKTEGSYEPEVHNNQDTPHVNSDVVACLATNVDASTKSLKHKDNNGRSLNSLFGDCDGPHNVDVDVDACSVVSPQNEDKCKNNNTKVQLNDHKKVINPCLKSDINGTTDVKIKFAVADSMRMQCRDENAANWKASCNTIWSGQDDMPINNQALVTYQSNSKELDKLRNTIGSKENILSQTALRLLLNKRDKLTLQQHNIEDEITLCDKKIQTILNGGQDNLAVTIESVIEGCNDVCTRSLTPERTSQHLENQCSPQHIKMKRLSEAVLNKQNSCQELDAICYENNWILPTYHVSPSDGGFQASINVKGIDFECSSTGKLCSNPREARESVAAQILGKLGIMASQAT